MSLHHSTAGSIAVPHSVLGSILSSIEFRDFELKGAIHVSWAKVRFSFPWNPFTHLNSSRFSVCLSASGQTAVPTEKHGCETEPGVKKTEVNKCCHFQKRFSLFLSTIIGKLGESDLQTLYFAETGINIAGVHVWAETRWCSAPLRHGVTCDFGFFPLHVCSCKKRCGLLNAAK